MLTTQIAQEAGRNMSSTMADMRLRSNEGNKFECGINYWCKLGHGHSDDCSRTVTEGQLAERDARIEQIKTKRANMITGAGVPKRRPKSARYYDKIPNPSKIKAAEERWVTRVRSASRSSEEFGDGLPSSPTTTRSGVCARRSAGQRESMERLMRGIPSSDDPFTQRVRRTSNGSISSSNSGGNTTSGSEQLTLTLILTRPLPLPSP
eukprot:TRINITY_DN6904_c0_g2_i1.p1 TRINITY_DN6904_c0_g2~~TRINITY_DN6904_c0_g2_i1.p1  ORF type:complete len:207 (-),score=34.44 TRINITY_DN6904_c0_g2_i1:31-651(-)